MKKPVPKTKPVPRDRESLLAMDKGELVDRLLSMEAQVGQLSDLVRDMMMQKYGRKTDRFEAPGQLLVFPGPEAAPQMEHKEVAEAKAESACKQKKAGHTRNPMPEHLERVPVAANEPPAEARQCPTCKSLRVEVRKILKHSRYGCVPASFFIEDLYSVVYECPNGHGKPLIVDVNEAVKNGIAAPSVMAQVAVSRHVDHMPFNRQSGMYKRSDVPLCRSTLSDIHAQTAGILLPLYDFMRPILLDSKVISTDDTPVKTLDRSKDKNIKTGRIWAHLGDSEHPVNLFDYTPGRGRDGPRSFLQGWNGKLQGDCFSGNLALCAERGTILVACMAHARRYFIKAMVTDKDGCNQALSMFQSLYEIERVAKELELPFEEIRLMREQEAVPLLNKFYEWLQRQYAVAQPKSSYGKALFYCLNNWTELKQYVTDGELKIDNNHVEREMKYVSMGKKAWLFFGSDQGGKNDAVVSSIISTCRRHGVEPLSYLTDVIEKLVENPGRNLEELLPFNWKGKSAASQAAKEGPVMGAPKMVSA